MTEAQLYDKLFKGGAYSLPYLIRLYHPNYGALYFVNNNEDITYDGHTYKASAFKYTKPKTLGGVLQNGSLEITAIENEAIDIIDSSDELFTVTAVGVINDGSVTPIKAFKHQYGSATTDDQMKITITFTNDDRLNMVFPPYVFDAENNRGNA
jgi:hypothetical protein